jgi:hypothetical protein
VTEQVSDVKSTSEVIPLVPRSPTTDPCSVSSVSRNEITPLKFKLVRDFDFEPSEESEEDPQSCRSDVPFTTFISQH